MSTTIDNKVLEMRFDNKQFESGVATSMSTLEKLKQKLNLSGASKGLDDLGKSAKKVSFDGMSSGIETVTAKFSALQIMGVTALANITNSAVNAGKRIVKALTIEPVTTGFKEYETQINAVQTILANTQKEGTNVQIVNKALDELNTYADKTIYNFAEMTKNIGTFTAAGVKLDTSVNAIQGIANLAAVSGSTSQQASTAMYQLSQALSSGTVKLMDWNSVVNAGMGGQVFQDALKETSELLGTGAEAAIAANGSFRESLQTGWMTSEVLTETLKKFTTSGANEYVAEYTGLSAEAVQAALDSAEAQYGEAEAIDKASEALARKSGKSKEEIKSALEFAKTAEDAATKVKTLTQLFDTLKEAAQSGWGQTWRILVGDFEEAKELFTGLSNFLGGFIQKSADSRNSILEGALSGNPFSKLAERIEKVTAVSEKATAITDKMTQATKDYGDVVNKVIGGDFGTGEVRFKALTEAGYDWAHAQNLVNEKLGDSTRHATEYKEAQEEVNNAQKEINKTQAVTIEDLVKMNDAQLKTLGFTKDEIEGFRQLEEQSKKTGIPINDLIQDLDQLNGRTLLLNSFKNAGSGLVAVFESVSKAWKDIFWNGASDEEIIQKKTESLYNVIAAVHKFSTYLTSDKVPVDELTRSLKGLFAIVDIITTVVGGGFKTAFMIVSKLLGAFDMDILSVTASLGDAIVAFRDFIFNNELINAGFELLADGILTVVSWIKKLASAFMDIPQVQNVINNIVEAFDNLRNIDLSEVGSNIIQGLQNGLGAGVSGIFTAIANIARTIIDTIKGILGIHSPSTVMIAIGGFIVAGLIIGLKTFAPELWAAITEMGSNILTNFTEIGSNIISKVTEIGEKIPWSKLFAAAVSLGMVMFIKKIADAMTGIASAFEGFGELLSSTAQVVARFGGVLKSFGKMLKGIAWDFKAKALLKMAISIGILVAAVVLLANVDIANAWNAVGIIAALSAILVGLAFAMDKMSGISAKFEKGKGFDVDGLKTGILQIGIALLLLAATVKIVGDMNPEQAIQGFVGLTVLMLEMIGFMAVVGLVVKGDAAKNMDKIGKMMWRLSFALILMVGVCKLVGMLSVGEMIKGAAFAAAFAIFVKTITAVAKSAGNNVSKVGGLALKLAIAMGLMVGVCKLVGLLSVEDMIKGAAFAAAFTLFVKAIVGIVKVGKKQSLAKISGLILSLSVSLLLMVGVCKLVGMLSPEEMIKGAIFVSAFMVLIKVLVEITTIGSDQKMAKVAATILAMSVAIGVLAAVSIALSLIDLAGLAKGVTAVSLLGLVMAAMIHGLKGANNVMPSLIVMTVAIGVMAAAVAVLSTIDSAKLAGAAASISAVMAMFALMTHSLKGLKNVPLAPLLAIVGVVAILGGILAALSMLEVGSTLEVAVSLSLLMLSLATSLKIISGIGPAAMAAIPAAFAMSGVLAIIAVILGVLAALNVGSTLEIAVSLSLLLLSLSASIAILAPIGVLAIAAMPAAFAMSGVLAIIAVILGVLAALNVGPTLEIAVSLSLLMMSLSAACLIMAGAAAIATVAAAGIIPLMGLMVGMGALMAVIAGLVTWQPDLEAFLNKALPILKLIGQGIGEFLGGIITGVGNAVLDLLPKLGMSLSLFMVGAQPFISLASTVDSSVLAGAGYLTGAIIALTAASFIAGIGQLLSFGPSFGELGTQLTEFAMNIIPFLATIKLVDESSITAVDSLSKMITALTGSSFLSGIDGLLSAFTGKSGFDTLKSQLVPFGEAIVDFSDTVKGKIDSASVEAAANAGLAMTKLSNAIPKSGGFLQDIVGEADLEKFGKMCKAFGKAIKEMSESLTGEGGAVLINDAAIEAAVKAGKSMSSVAKAIPKADGFLQDIVGEQDLAKFGETCKAFGKAIKEMSESLTGEDGASLVNNDIIGTATKAGEAMAALQKAIPEDGWFDGKVSLDDFGKQISTFGKSIVSYAKTVAEADLTNVSSSISQAESLVSLAKTISESKLDNIDNFSKITSIGSAIRDYSKKISEINTEQVASSITSANRLKTFVSGLAGFDSSGIANFKIDTLGKSIKSYSESVAGFNQESVSASISSINRLASTIRGLAGLDTSGVAAFSSAVGNLGKVEISGIINTFSGASSKLSGIGGNLIESISRGMKSKSGSLSTTVTSMVNQMCNTIKSKNSSFLAAGKALIAEMVNGIKSKKSDVTSAVNSTVSGAATATKSQYSSFYSAGAYLVSGFIRGIRNNISSAASASAAMASAASSAARKNLQINSPSKVFRKIGSSVPEGFAQGISMLGNVVSKTVTGMTKKATDSANYTMSRMLNVFNGDMDVQPTIRPVIDLSNIKNGVSAIDRMLDTNKSISVISNLRSIGYSIDSKNQNGSMDDVVSAIDKLRKDLGNVGNTSYNINGITYDDGSNISEAIEKLVRASKVERRI